MTWIKRPHVRQNTIGRLCTGGRKECLKVENMEIQKLGAVMKKAAHNKLKSIHKT